MFTKKSEIESQLDDEIQTLLTKLQTPDMKPEDYGKIVEHMTALHKLKTEERPKHISSDTMLIVAANIFGILWLTRFERENVIPSKSALGFINTKLR
jgi:hypothetical protein